MILNNLRGSFIKINVRVLFWYLRFPVFPRNRNITIYVCLNNVIESITPTVSIFFVDVEIILWVIVGKDGK